MKVNPLLRQLKFFITPHPTFIGSEEDIYSVKEELKIKLWIEGGFTIDLEPLTFEINFNSIRSGILVIADRKKSNVIRLLSNKIIGLELIQNGNFKDDTNLLFGLKEEQKN